MSFVISRHCIRLLKLFDPLKSSRYSSGLSTNLIKKKMRAKLEGDQRNDILKQLETNGWKLVDNRDALSKTFLFKNFKAFFHHFVLNFVILGFVINNFVLYLDMDSSKKKSEFNR